MDEDDMNDVDIMLRELPLPFLRVLGVQAGKISADSEPEVFITAIKNAIRAEAEVFVYMRGVEKIDYLNWLDPDSYDFEDQESDQGEEGEEEPMEIDEGEIIDLNAAFIDEDPNDISHFAFFDRTPMVLDEIEPEGLQNVFDDEYEESGLEQAPKYHIEPMMLVLETAAELSHTIECVVCLDEKSAIHFDTTNCGHSFCHSCICRHIDSSRNGPSCPNCRTMIRTLEVKDIENYDDIFNKYGTVQEDIPLNIYL
jgi:hypothetical protein